MPVIFIVRCMTCCCQSDWTLCVDMMLPSNFSSCISHALFAPKV